jgi:hypothetical protein
MRKAEPKGGRAAAHIFYFQKYTTGQETGEVRIWVIGVIYMRRSEQ